MSRGPEQLRLTPDERADLVAYIDGELPEAHLPVHRDQADPERDGRREVEMLKKTWEMLGHLPRPSGHPSSSPSGRSRRSDGSSWKPPPGSRVKAWSARAAHVVVYLVIGGRRSRAGLCCHPLDLAGSFGAAGSRLVPGRTPGRISGGRLIRVPDPTGRFSRIRPRASLRSRLGTPANVSP